MKARSGRRIARRLLPLAGLISVIAAGIGGAAGGAGVAGGAGAATAYVSDDLVLGVYAEPNSAGERLTTLHSGALVEMLDTAGAGGGAGGALGDFTRVRLPDGRIGWVKSSYLTTRVPAAVRVKQLEEELDGRHATTPELAAAAARSELEALKGELAAKESELASARATGGDALGSGLAHAGPPLAHGMLAMRPFGWIASISAALLAGFVAGYAVLARRIRQKYGGLKIY